MEGFSAAASAIWGNVIDDGAFMIRTTIYKITGWDMGVLLSAAMFFVFLVAIALFVVSKLKPKRKTMYLMETGHYVRRR